MKRLAGISDAGKLEDAEETPFERHTRSDFQRKNTSHVA
jgi:hypothetical protein